MKKKWFLVVLIALTVALVVPQPAQAGFYLPPVPPAPAAGVWSWADSTVTGTVTPQYLLTPPAEDDYATLQSSGITLSGGTQVCHPYRGGQFGWTAEIRMLTTSGWQAVPTTNEWSPDEEGQFMTCAQAVSSGTYAVFGYWERPEGWEDRCLVNLPGSDLVNLGPAASFQWNAVNTSISGANPSLCTENPVNYVGSLNGTAQVYCVCNIIFLQTIGE